MKVYRFIFHKYYVLFSGFSDSAGFATNMLLCWLLMFNSFTIVHYFLAEVISPNIISKPIIVVYIIFILIGHLTYFNSNRVDKIVNVEFKDENIIFGRIGILVAIIFAILSVWFFFNYTVPFVGDN